METPQRPTLTIPQAISELVTSIQARRLAAERQIAKYQDELSKCDATLAHLAKAVQAANGEKPPKRTWTRHKKEEVPQ
jgi:hypothetical protein